MIIFGNHGLNMSVFAIKSVFRSRLFFCFIFASFLLNTCTYFNYTNVNLVRLLSTNGKRIQTQTNNSFSRKFIKNAARSGTGDSNAKLILFWTEFWLTYYRWSKLFVDTKEDLCPNCTCVLSVNKDDLGSAHAVVFHLLDLSFSSYHLPHHRPEGQIWILFSLESPVYRYMDQVKYNRLRRLFNWTMSYHRNSDLPVPYGLVLPNKKTDYSNIHIMLPNDLEAKSSELPKVNQKRLVAWSVSNCHSRSGREIYAKELAKHIKVDIYGSCSGNKCGIRESVDRQIGDDRNTKCNKILSTYKFFLAFENAICTDYITEKFFRTLSLGVVPVVLGGGDYSQVAPAGSYIDALKFSPKELAAYLTYLDSNSTAYQQYFNWRRDHHVVNSHPMRPLTCGLCYKLNHPDGSSRVHESVADLFSTSQCRRGVTPSG